MVCWAHNLDARCPESSNVIGDIADKRFEHCAPNNRRYRHNLHTTAPCLSQIALKFGEHRSTFSCLNVAPKWLSPVELVVGEGRLKLQGGHCRTTVYIQCFLLIQLKRKHHRLDVYTVSIVREYVFTFFWKFKKRDFYVFTRATLC